MKLEIKATECKTTNNGTTAAPVAYFTDKDTFTAAAFVTVTTEQVFMLPGACLDNVLKSNNVPAALDAVHAVSAPATTTAKVTRTTVADNGAMDSGKGKYAAALAYSLYNDLTAKGKGSKERKDNATATLAAWNASAEAARARAAAACIDNVVTTVDPAAAAAAILANPTLAAALAAALGK